MDLISYQLGNEAPPLMVTGLRGACSSLILAPNFIGDSWREKKSKKPSDVSPNP